MKDGALRDDGRAAHAPHAHDEPDLLRDQFSQLLRYRGLIIWGMVLGVLAGAALGFAGSNSYEANTDVTLRAVTTDPLADNAFSTNSISMGSERSIALGKLIAEKAADELGYEGRLASLSRELQVTNPPNTVVLRFTYTADDPKTAAERANAFADAYLGSRRSETEERIDRMINAYEEQRGPLVKERDRLNSGIGAGGASESTLSSLSSIIGRIAEINSDISKLEALDTTPGRIVSKASPPESPAGPGLVLLIGLGLAVGLGLGMLVAWVRLVFDPTVRSAGDVVRALRAPVLGTLPRLGRGLPDMLLAEGRLAEEYRSVAFRLAYDETFAQRRRVLVVAPRGSIATALAASVNLSAAFAEMGKDALLIEADLRTPTLTDQLHHADGVRPGWARTPQQSSTGWPAGRRVPIDAGESGVFDLVPGHRVRNVPRSLTSPAATQLISEADERNSVVVVLAPAVLSYADAIALIDRVDTVLVVCDPKEVRREDLNRVRELVVGAGGILLGAVLHPYGSDLKDAKRSKRKGGGKGAVPAAGTGAGQEQKPGRPEEPAKGGRDASGREGGRAVKDVPHRDVGSTTVGLRIVDPAELEERERSSRS